MNYNITRFDRCDILKPDFERLGFDKNIPEEEMIKLAIQHGSSAIIKNGKGKWYLKGHGKTTGSLREKINNNIGKYREGVYCLLIEPVEPNIEDVALALLQLGEETMSG